VKQLKAPVVSNMEVLPETRLVRLEAPEIAADAVPGQFVMVHCGEETTLRRPISIHRVDGGSLDLLIAVVGSVICVYETGL
jgi:dihydroorotate dehydrogenase electron transfer subunit